MFDGYFQHKAILHGGLTQSKYPDLGSQLPFPSRFPSGVYKASSPSQWPDRLGFSPNSITLLLFNFLVHVYILFIIYNNTIYQ